MNGLEAEYPDINFIRFNAYERENELLQTQLGVRGHPSVAIVTADGSVTNTYFGPQSADDLRQALDALTHE